MDKHYPNNADQYIKNEAPPPISLGKVSTNYSSNSVPNTSNNCEYCVILGILLSDTLSAKMTLVTIKRPAQPIPCNALPTSSIENAVTGALAQSTLPTSIVTKAVCKAV
jgi:hypothetical protein